MRLIAVAVLFIASTISCATPAALASDNESSRIGRLLPERDGMIKLGYTYTTDADVRNEPGSFELHVMRFKGGVPIPLSDKAAFVPGVIVDLYRFHLNDVLNYLDQNHLNLYTVGPTFDAYVELNDNWMLAFDFQPLITSDLKGLGWKDMQFRGYGLAGWAFSEHASFLFGIAVNKEFWRYLPIPVVGFVVRPEQSFFALETLLPAYLRMDFTVASFCTLFIQGEFEGDTWWVRGGGTVPDHFGKLMDTSAGAGARFRIIRGLEIEAWGGVNPYRRVQFRNRAGQTVTEKIQKSYFAEGNIVITAEIFRR